MESFLIRVVVDDASPADELHGVAIHLRTETSRIFRTDAELIDVVRHAIARRADDAPSPDAPYPDAPLAGPTIPST
jgi:hypothetical protein